MTNNFTKIVAYDEHGNIYTLWDSATWYGLNKSLETNKEANSNSSPMPEIETGTFIKMNALSESKNEYGFIYNDYIIWQNGGWDKVTSLHEEKHKDNILEDLVELTIFKDDGYARFPDGDEEETGYYQPILWKGKVWYG